MTASRLEAKGTDSPRHAVVGECTEENTVPHVGILERARTIKAGEVVSVFHMANPASRLQMPGTMSAHAVGWVLDLLDHEHEEIGLWLQELATSTIQIEYVAFPANDVVADKVTGRTIGRKFSCAGFVQACFDESIQIRLIVPTDELPDVSRDVLLCVWEERYLSIARRYGLRGPGPWKVLLPSYLFHALSKERSGLPHKPPSPDPYFRT
jgi:hypothetical protein